MAQFFKLKQYIFEYQKKDEDCLSDIFVSNEAIACIEKCRDNRMEQSNIIYANGAYINNIVGTPQEIIKKLCLQT